MRRISIVLAFCVVAPVAGLVAAAAPASASTITVGPGQSIQAAINSAHAGDTILVKQGTYVQQFFITKDDITVKGSGKTVLLPPPKKDQKQCAPTAGSFEGICVRGSSPSKPVVGDKVSGFEVKQFADAGIAVAFGKNTQVSHNHLVGNHGEGIFAIGSLSVGISDNTATNNGGYGIFANQSQGTSIADNTASGSGEAGVYVGDSPNATALVTGNHTHDNALGIFVRNAERGAIGQNQIVGNCAGILFLADSPGPSGEFQVVGNDISHNNRFCPKATGSEAHPAISGSGILLWGANGVAAHTNTIANNVPSGASSGPPIGDGVQVVNGPGGTKPVSNTVTNNTFEANKPFDIFAPRAPASNVLKPNDCDTSKPAGLC